MHDGLSQIRVLGAIESTGGYGTTNSWPKSPLGLYHGAQNRTLFQKEMSLEEVMSSPMVVDPLRLFMLCSDGAAAVIVCNERRKENR